MVPRDNGMDGLGEVTVDNSRGQNILQYRIVTVGVLTY